jgi:hypothetical protein
LNDELIQNEYFLGRLLWLSEMEQVFGADLQYELQVLFHREEIGLRNRLSHGLMHQGEFTGHACIYAWWLITRLCLLPLFVPDERENAGDKQ